MRRPESFITDTMPPWAMVQVQGKSDGWSNLLTATPESESEAMEPDGDHSLPSVPFQSPVVV